MTTYASPLLDLPDAVPADGVDAGVAAHYGNPFREQKTLLTGDGFVDLSHRGVVTITGPDRLTWLHSLTTQHLEGLAPNSWTTTLVLSPQGHVEHAMTGYDDGETFWAHVEPGAAEALVSWLDSMRFMMRVEVSDVTDAWALVARGETEVELVPRAELQHRGVGRAVRRVGVRRVADRPGRAAPRPRHRPPHHPERGRLDRPGRPSRQGLLPRPGDGGPDPHPRSSAAAARDPAPRRLRRHAARPGRCRVCSTGATSASSAPRPGTTSSARSRWRS